MKTPMQELIEALESVGWKFQEEIKAEYLEKEKQQIIEAYRKGYVCAFLEQKQTNEPEQYYNETFNNHE